MAFLHENIAYYRADNLSTELPACIKENLNQKFELRPYQKEAFQNFIAHFERTSCPHPTQVLFHMATGSGKTLIMAGLILYLYQKGYRNFLFFVNLSTIVKKTEDNFLNAASSKYLFADEIVVDGERIPIRKVDNFQASDSNAINICFSTTQGLHTSMNFTKENSMSFDDFENMKTVLISDEAHHLNVSTKKGKLSPEEEENKRSWEQTVEYIFRKNSENVLLEFTATCDLNNPLIKAAYEQKIIFDYPLHKFRRDCYSKDIKTLRTELDNVMDRAILALILSQYRLKIFQANHIAMKPIVLFKSYTIAKSKLNMDAFIKRVQGLDGAELERVSTLIDNPTMQKAYQYFFDKGISFDMLAQELREDFSEDHCISVNEDKDAEQKQILLNSLEDANNPYRAIFEVKKLDEGWDVLNLFDIVRLYETRQSGKNKVSSTTVSEAQLIGRGARYCPFKIDEEQPKYQRKYDNDVGNELRICEELYYHCQNDSRYISELRQALKDIGASPDGFVTRTYTLKDDFKKDELYKTGLIFVNERILKSRQDVTSLVESLRSKVHPITLSTGQSGEDIVLEDDSHYSVNSGERLECYRTTIGKIAQLNYAIVNKALAKYPVFKFHTLKSKYPNIKSTREFVTSGNYLGDIAVEIHSKFKEPSISILNAAVTNVISKIGAAISGIKEEFEGTKEFTAHNVRDIFKNKSVNYTKVVDDSVGMSQNDSSISAEIRLDLENEDWFAFNDNFGTSEEKAFVKFFADNVEEIKKEYDKVFLLRNERQMHIYSFEGGERFEPDFVLFLQKNDVDGYDQLQVFIEPKGSHLIKNDKWKEDFLLQLKSNAVAKKVFVDDNNYRIWGLHFFNREKRDKEFRKDFEELASGKV